MINAFVAVLLIAPLMGVLGTMAVNNKMAFFSDALGHSGFTGIAIGVLCGAALPIGWAVALAVAAAVNLLDLARVDRRYLAVEDVTFQRAPNDAAADVLAQAGFKLALICALQDDFAQFQQKNFFHHITSKI